MNPNVSFLAELELAQLPEAVVEETGADGAAAAASDAASDAGVKSRPGVFVFPATLEQSRYWALDRLESDSPALKVRLAWSLEGFIHDSFVNEALSLMTDRHLSLRTVFSLEDTALHQMVSKAGQFAMWVKDLTALELEEQQLALDAAIDGTWSLDLSHGPLFAAELLHLSDHKHLLVLSIHKIICDEWSTRILLREFAEGYDALLNHRTPQLPELPCHFADVAVWQQDWLHGKEASDAREFWRSVAERNFTAVDLPLDHRRTAKRTGRAGIHSRIFPAELAGRLNEFAARHQQAREAVLLAAFQALLSRYTGQQEFLLGRRQVDRREVGTEHVVGRFADDEVVVADVAGDPTFGELMARVRSWEARSSPHQALPFLQIAEQFQAEGVCGASSGLLRVHFSSQTSNTRVTAVGSQPSTGLRIVPCATSAASVDFDLALSFIDDQRHLGEKEPELRIEYNAELLKGARMQQLLKLLLEVVDAATANPALRVSQLPFLTEAEQAELEAAAEGGPLQLNILRTPSLVELIEAHAHRRPYDTAIVADGKELNWETLMKQAREYSAALRSRGVRKGSLVAVRMEPRVETAVCCLALLTLSAAVVPVPETADAHVWERVWKSVCPELAIAAKGYLRPSWATWNFEALAASYMKPGDVSMVEPEDVACVVLSSSEDQDIVGVPVSHWTAVRVLRGAAETMKLGESDVLQILPASGSLEAWSDLMMGLCTGARTVLFGGEEQLRVELAGRAATARYLIGSHSQVIAAIHHSGVAGAFASVAPEMAAPGSMAATVFCREGRLSQAQRRAVAAKGVRGYSLLYACAAGGPVALSRIGGGSSEPKLVPVAGCRLRLEDAYGQCAPSGVDGVLFVNVGDEFVRDNAEPRERRLATGWICRFDADKGLIVVDAVQRRINLNRNRMHLLELEEALLSHPSVAQAVAVIHPNEHRQPALHAYLIARQQGPQKLTGIREALRQSLPESLASTELHWVREYPRRADGTVDGARLEPSILAPTSLPAAPASDSAARLEPELAPSEVNQPAHAVDDVDGMEGIIAEIWERVLGVRSISLTANFFELGSYSAMIPRLFARINQSLGTDLPATAIFNAPTIGELAGVVRGTTRLTTLVPVQTKGVRPPLFVIHSYPLYAALMEAVEADQPIYGLQELAEDHDDSVESRIARYLSEIRKVQQHGPYHLAGWGEAGLLVAEAARQLKRSGDALGQVFLFDSANTKSAGVAIDRGGNLPRKSSFGQSGISEWKESMLLRCRALLLKISSKWKLHFPELRQKVSCPTRGTSLMSEQQFDGRITLIRSSGSPREFAPGSVACGWENVARGGVEVHWLPADRGSMFTGDGLKSVGHLVRSRISGKLPAA